MIETKLMTHTLFCLCPLGMLNERQFAS